MQLLCLDLEADTMEWQGPRGGLGNFLGWMDPDLERLDSSTTQEERTEVIEQVTDAVLQRTRRSGGHDVSWVIKYNVCICLLNISVLVCSLGSSNVCVYALDRIGMLVQLRGYA